MRRVETRLRVRYAETDQMGIVYYANYLVWMELGRAEYCRAAGIRYRDMEQEDGILLAVAEVNCRYASPARYDEEVIVRTWIEQAHPRMVRFAYEMIEAATSRVLATGETKHVFSGRDLKPRKLPEKYRAAFGIAGTGAVPRAGLPSRLAAAETPAGASAGTQRVPQMGAVGGGKAAVFAGILPCGELPAVTPEIFGDVAAELKTVHTVREIPGVRQTQGVAGFVKAGEINDRVAQQPVAAARIDDPHIHLRASLAVHLDRHGFAIQTFLGQRPNDAETCVIAVRRDEPEPPVRCALPGFQRPAAKLDVAGGAAGFLALAGLDPIRQVSRAEREREANAQKKFFHPPSFPQARAPWIQAAPRGGRAR